MIMPLPARQFAITILAVSIFLAGCSSSSVTGPGGFTADPTAHSSGAPATRILSSVPDVRQSTPYSCGAASLQAVLKYWGKDLREGELSAMLTTTEEGGTPPQNIVNVSRTLGLSAELRTDLALSDLEAAFSAGIPVIVGMRDRRYNTSPPFPVDNRGFGHYMVVIGLDAENVYLEDPALLGTRAVMTRKEFLARWQDFSGRDIRNTDAVTFRRPAVFIKGEAPVHYPEFTRSD